MLPVVDASELQYISFYTGYHNGFSYFSPGYYKASHIEEPFVPDNVSCTIPEADKIIGYDPRCRSWYQAAILPEYQKYAMVSEPYLSTDGAFIYITVDEFCKLSGDKNSVVAIDLNMNNPFY